MHYIPIIVAIVSFIGIFGAIARANDDIFHGGKLWLQGLPDWATSITVSPGQEFKITMYSGNLSADTSVTGVREVDELPEHTTFQTGTVYELIAGVWNSVADSGTSPFVGAGLIVNDGTLEPFEFVNYKYTVKVDNFLPAGTSNLSWAGPVLHFTDASGPQTTPNPEATSILVANLPGISSFTLSGNGAYKLGEVITIAASGDAGKSVHVEVGATAIPLTESPAGSGQYQGTYTIAAGDDTADQVLPRIYFDNGDSTGSYKDAAASVTIDATLPPAPEGFAKTFDSQAKTAALSWVPPESETDVNHYEIYSNSGAGDINYSSALAVVEPGVNQYVTAPLSNDLLYKFAVRAVDAAGNNDGNANTVSVSTDVTPPEPPAALIAPTSANDVIIASPVDFSWEASLNTAGDLDKYRLEIANNPGFDPIASTTETDSQTLSVSGVSLADGIYYWRVFAVDVYENESAQTSPDNTFEIDTVDPIIAISSPSVGAHISGDFTVGGTASDGAGHLAGGTGLASVEVILFSIGAGPNGETAYWNGSAWVTAETFVPAAVAANDWTYNFNFSGTETIVNGRQYVLGARVTDQAGHAALRDGPLFALTGNTAAPVPAITSPLSGQHLGSSVSIAGTASDPGGTAISSAEVSIQRSNDSLFWDGTAWVNGEIWNTVFSADAFANWTYAFALDGTSPEGSIFTVKSRAKDSAFPSPNQGTSGAITLNKDTIAPTVAITSPANSSIYRAITWDAAGPIQGTASDAGAGVLSVEVAIKDSSNNYWNGIDWSSPEAVWLNAASTSGNFAAWKYLNASQNFIPNKDGVFVIYARATDKAIGAANTSAQGSGLVFTYDTIAPAVSNAVVANNTLGITDLAKNGDVVVLSATIADAHQTDMGPANISADLSAITGSLTLVAPLSYDSATGLATWPFRTVSGTTNGDLGISITVTDPAGNAATFANTAIISADNIAPSAGQAAVPFSVLKGGTTQAITWSNASVADANLKANPISLEYDDGLSWTAISQNELNDGTYDWITPALNLPSVNIRLWAEDRVGLRSYSDSVQFKIDSMAPAVPGTAITSPNGDEAWKQGTSQNIAWNNASVTDNFGLAANPITLEYATDGSNWISIATNEANDGSLNWIVPAIDFNTVKIRLSAVDEAGNTASDESDSNFAIGLPPEIIAARAVGDARIEIEWDKPIGSAGSFANYAATGLAPMAAAISGTNNKIINLVVSSLGNTAFTAADLAIAINTVRDADNFYNEAQSGKNISDNQAPITNIPASYPRANQLIAEARPILNISVSEEPGALTVVKIDNNALSFTYNPVLKIIALTPEADLAPGKHTIILNLADTSGNTEAEKTWDFWVDDFSYQVTAHNPSFHFAGNLFDATDASESQDVSISTYGAGFALYALITDAVADNYGNSIDDINIKEANGVWTSLSGTTRVLIASAPKLLAPSDSIIANNYTFDLKAAIPSLMQAAGNYRGKLEFIVAMEY